MQASWADIVGSRTFKFIVSEDVDGKATEFEVYEEAIAGLSENLRATMTGYMVEAGEGVVWKHVSKQTFEQFYQFAMMGDYSIPEPERREEAGPEDFLDSEVEAETEYPSATDLELVEWRKKDEANSSSPEEGSRKKPDCLPCGLFPSLSYPLIAPRSRFLDTFEPSDLFLKSRSYSNVLLSHDNLYILADCRMIDDLKALALHKLHQTLLIFKLDSENLDDIIDLVYCAYTEEGRGSEGRKTAEGPGLLRDMVCRFLVTHTVTLTADKKFMELLGNGGDFARDIWKYEGQINHVDSWDRDKDPFGPPSVLMGSESDIVIATVVFLLLIGSAQAFTFLFSIRDIQCDHSVIGQSVAATKQRSATGIPFHSRPPLWNNSIPIEILLELFHSRGIYSMEFMEFPDNINHMIGKKSPRSGQPIGSSNLALDYLPVFIVAPALRDFTWSS